MAVLQLKNAVGKRWRKGLQGALSPEEKAHLRARLVSAIGELEDRRLAVQLGLTIARCARVDYPTEWPGLLAELWALVEGNHLGIQGRRALLVLHYVIKELASKRLAADQRVFEEASAALLPRVGARWAAETADLLAALQGRAQGPIDALFEAWYLELKSLRRLLAQGFPADARSLACPPAIVESLPVLIGALRAMAGSLSSAPAARGAVKLWKTILQLQERHPWSFWASGTLLPLMEWCVNWLAEVAPAAVQDDAPSALLRFPIIFLYQTTRCPSYRGASASLTLSLSARKQVSQQASMAAEVQPGLEAFWAQDGRRERVLRRLVAAYLPLSVAELEEWAADPEAFHHAALNVAWEESVHGCAEHLASALFEGQREALAPVAVELLRSVAAVDGSAAGQLAKEAVYRLAAVVAHELQDAVDFSAWLQAPGGLLADAAAPGAAGPQPVRRQALLLPSYWLGALKPPDRAALYERALEALQPSAVNDLAVRLAALVTLQALVEDWGFEEEAFAPCAPRCFEALAALLRDAAELDSQVQAFNLINTLIDRLADGAAPFAGGLLRLLPAVWAGPARGAPLLGMQLLGTVARLAHALGEAGSPGTYPVLVPALQAVLNPAGDVGLLEDGLQTWLVALRAAPSADRSALSAVWPGAWAPVMESSTEHVAVGSQIAGAALLLGEAARLPGPGEARAGAALAPPTAATSFFFAPESPHGAALGATLALWLRSVNDRGVALVAGALALAAQLADREEALAGPVAALLDRALVPEGAPGALGSPAFAAAICALSRVALRAGGSPLPLLRLLGSAERGAALLDAWVSRFDCVGRAGLRKLAAFGLATLLAAPLGAQVFSASLEAAAAHLTAAWFEVEESGPDGPLAPGAAAANPPTDHLFLDFLAPSSSHDEGAVVNSDDAAGEAGRRDALWRADPIRTVTLGAFVRQQLDAAAATHGHAVAQAALEAMDPTLREQLQRMLGAGGA